ncbi:threonine/serine exporter family protein [Erysipelothrix anatis]|uniref:threonine/serine exporter family protein n=1 Tax=Erysipelothrix anatis TaxID=2683713 RepID=UPI00135BC756|nr:threonine/serine exporter family protein [Erysipelothrix anatis]
MAFLIQVVTSFVSSLGFGIIVNAPRRVLIHCGITGMVGWIVNWCLLLIGYNTYISVFAGSVAVSICAIMFARKLRMPTTVFNLPGIFPLVPGISAYQAIQSFVSAEYIRGVELLMKTFTISMTMAFAIVMIEVFYRLVMRILNGELNKKTS